MNAVRQSFAAFLLCLLVALPASADLYEVTVTDLISGGPATGQPMSPPVGIVHGAGYAVFALGAPASPGLEAVAEEGDFSTLVAEAMGDADVYDVATGPGPFFDVSTFMVEGSPGDLLSVVMMLGRTNDLFTGLAALPLPADMTPAVVEPTTVWDAGTEQNTGMIEHIPFYGNANAGPDENGVVATIDTYSVVNDPDYGTLVWDFPPAARITVQRLDPTPTEDGNWSAVKRLY
jgi:hypothetical protein